MKTVFLLITGAFYLAIMVYGCYFMFHAEMHPTDGDVLMMCILLAGVITFYSLFEALESPEKRLIAILMHFMGFQAE